MLCAYATSTIYRRLHITEVLCCTGHFYLFTEILMRAVDMIKLESERGVPMQRIWAERGRCSGREGAGERRPALCLPLIQVRMERRPCDFVLAFCFRLL